VAEISASQPSQSRVRQPRHLSPIGGVRCKRSKRLPSCVVTSLPPSWFCMPVRFKLRGPCSSARTIQSTPKRLSRPPPTLTAPTRPTTAPRAQALQLRSHILKMDARDLSDKSNSSGDGLKLKNRLNESRSPYVRTRALLHLTGC
jgi:hypothetical protein